MNPKQPEEAPKAEGGPGPIEEPSAAMPAAGWQMEDRLGVNKYASPADGRTQLGGTPSPNGNPFGGKHAT
jgi:hypothetical protein